MNPDKLHPDAGRRRRRRRRSSAKRRQLQYVLGFAIIGAVAASTFIYVLNRPSGAVSGKTVSIEDILQKRTSPP